MAPNPLNVKDTHPRRDFAGITQLGLKALALVQAHQTELDPRLPAGLLTGLGAHLTALGVVVPSVHQAHAGVQLATEARDAVAERTVKCVKAMRTAVRDAGAPAEVQHAYGVGKALDKRRRAVLEAVVNLIFERLEAHPEDVAGFGFVQADIDALKALHADVVTTSATQQQKRVDAPLTTKERNRTGNRILAAVRRIRGAGVLAFAQDPVVRDAFAALRLGPRKTTKTPAPPAHGKGAPQPATPVAPAPAQPTDAAPKPVTPADPTPVPPPAPAPVPTP